MVLDGDKISFLGNYSHNLYKGVEISKKLYSRTKDRAHLGHALNLAEQNKSVLLLDALKKQEENSFGGIPQELLEKEEKLIGQVASLQKEVGLADNKEEEEKKKLGLAKVILDYTNFKEDLKETYPQYFELKYGETTVDYIQIQEKLTEGKALLEYFICPDKVFLFYIDVTDIELYELAIEKDVLTKEIGEMRKALSNYGFLTGQQKKAVALLNEKGYWFYKELVAPILQSKPSINQLVIIPDGELNYLPFESFLTEKPSQTNTLKSNPYLLQKYSVSYSYSSLIWLKNKNKKAHQNNGELLAIASDYNQLDSSSFGGTLYEQSIRSKLIPLPAAVAEVEGLIGAYQGTALKGMEANELNFKSNVANYGIVHLAMHGVLNQENPILSNLVFTADSNQTEDNFLCAYEISKLKLNADLVVLSACETGYGKFEQGEGVMSLARSFMYAGTPSLVVSLWQVNDKSTAIVMQLFYENLNKGMSKDKALQQAKLNYIQRADGIAAHPAFWSPFIQLGDEKPVVLKRKNSIGYWIGGIGVGLLFLVGMFAAKKRKEV